MLECFPCSMGFLAWIRFSGELCGLRKPGRALNRANRLSGRSQARQEIGANPRSPITAHRALRRSEAVRGSRTL